ncbi:MAG: acyltransferase, partial [Janthinobacterium sp.]
DNWAPYFFGSYGLGLMAWWASDPARKPGAMTALMAMAAVPVLLALAIDYRSRIALALIVACALFLFGRARTPSQGRAWNIVNTLGRISYAVFLVHFPVSLLVNALFVTYAPLEPAWQALGMLTAWSGSLAAGAAFHRWVEVPLGRVMGGVVAHLAGRPALVSR